MGQRRGVEGYRLVGRTYRIRVHAPRRGRLRWAGVTECADLLFHIRVPRAQQSFRTSWGSESKRGGREGEEVEDEKKEGRRGGERG